MTDMARQDTTLPDARSRHDSPLAFGRVFRHNADGEVVG